MSSTVRLELWQTEWCPASHRVRQRLTELDLSYTLHQVPVAQDQRTELQAVTGQVEIPVLVADDVVVAGEQRIATYLDDHFAEPPGAGEQREKAAKAKRRELEEACPKLTAATA